MVDNKYVKKAEKELEYLSGDEETRRLAELREKAIRDEKALYNTGIREGKELGREEGERKNKIEVISRMLKDNMDIELIKKYANATDEEIEEARVEK